MRNLFFVLFLISLTLGAQRLFTPEYPRLGAVDDVLCLTAYGDTIPLTPERDTILSDGSVSKIYFLPRFCYSGPSPSWRFMRMPDGVDMILPCFAEFPYPTGLKPGLYNLVEDYVKVVGMNENGAPIVETHNWNEPTQSQRAPEPEQTTVTSQTVSEPVQNTPKSDPCSFQTRDKTIPLYGRVQVVSSFADFKVQVVGSFSDLKVQKVTSFPNDCGEWQFVESFPDFTIQYVESFPDLKIQFVDAFPGTP